MVSTIAAGVLEISFEEHGSRSGTPVVLLHGFPYDVRAYDVVAADLAADGCRVVVPYLRGYGPTSFIDDGTMRSGQQAALAADLLALLDALEIDRAVVGGYDWGGRAACIVSALWPDRVLGLVSGGGYNIQDIAASGEPRSPDDEHRAWYQYYLHGERGRAGLDRNRVEFCRLLWSLWSPTWTFEDATYAATAASFENADFVDIVVHSYRHRFGLVPGDPRYEDIESRLSTRPPITVPSVVLRGGDDGVDPPPAHALGAPPRGFTGPVDARIVPGAGHNLPQEDPVAFAAAVRALL
ncbi:MAG: alpha/beta hydrolase fold family protein [Acidimicrobiales bacterium]|nr:alpha/beta hydrolase fold family protein [Acidimicrobiales bacterium]